MQQRLGKFGFRFHIALSNFRLRPQRSCGISHFKCPGSSSLTLIFNIPCALDQQQHLFFSFNASNIATEFSDGRGFCFNIQIKNSGGDRQWQRRATSPVRSSSSIQRQRWPFSFVPAAASVSTVAKSAAATHLYAARLLSIACALRTASTC